MYICTQRTPEQPHDPTRTWVHQTWTQRIAPLSRAHQETGGGGGSGGAVKSVEVAQAGRGVGISRGNSKHEQGDVVANGLLKTALAAGKVVCADEVLRVAAGVRRGRWELEVAREGVCAEEGVHGQTYDVVEERGAHAREALEAEVCVCVGLCVP